MCSRAIDVLLRSPGVGLVQKQDSRGAFIALDTNGDKSLSKDEVRDIGETLSSGMRSQMSTACQVHLLWYLRSLQCCSF